MTFCFRLSVFLEVQFSVLQPPSSTKAARSTTPSCVMAFCDDNSCWMKIVSELTATKSCRRYVLGSPHVSLWGFVTKSTRMVQTGTLDSAMDAAARDKQNPHMNIDARSAGPP